MVMSQQLPQTSRFFNTAGLCRLGRHYLLRPKNRLPEVLRLLVIEESVDGPSPKQLNTWLQRFPRPGSKAARWAKKTAKKKSS